MGYEGYSLARRRLMRKALDSARHPGYSEATFGGSMVKGVQFVVDAQGEKTAVVIDLKKHGALWEDFYDSAVAHARRDEARETLEAVKRRLSQRRKLRRNG